MYPSIKKTISGVLSHMRYLEDSYGDVGPLCLYPDMSGHIDMNEGSNNESDKIGFDNLSELVDKLLTFEATIISWKEGSLCIMIRNFLDFNVCDDIEEKSDEIEYEWVVDSEWLINDGWMKDRTDSNGLLNYLVKSKILPKGSKLVIDDWDAKNGNK